MALWPRGRQRAGPQLGSGLPWTLVGAEIQVGGWGDDKGAAAGWRQRRRCGRQDPGVPDDTEREDEVGAAAARPVIATPRWEVRATAAWPKRPR